MRAVREEGIADRARTCRRRAASRFVRPCEGGSEKVLRESRNARMVCVLRGGEKKGERGEGRPLG